VIVRIPRSLLTRTESLIHDQPIRIGETVSALLIPGLRVFPEMDKCLKGNFAQYSTTSTCTCTSAREVGVRSGVVGSRGGGWVRGCFLRAPQNWKVEEPSVR